jgi:hypothetical protein
MTAAVGWARATSRAKLGPESTATAVAGQRSLTTSLMRRCRAGSKPFVADTTGTVTGRSRASVASKYSDGTATITSVAPSSAAAASLVASIPAGSSTSDRYHGFRRRARIASTTSPLRAHSVTRSPPRAR